MKKTLFFVFLAAFFLLAGNLLNAQELSRDEKKELKKAAKAYKRNPASLKILIEEHAEYKGRNEELREELNRMEQEKANLNRQQASLQMDVEGLRGQLQDCRTALSARPQQPQQPLDTDAQVMGIVFKVQIGAYSELKVDSQLDTSKNLELEGGDSVQKVVVGQFRDYDKARQLRDKLRTMGVKDAWVVSYRDGQRIPIEEAIRK